MSKIKNEGSNKDDSEKIINNLKKKIKKIEKEVKVLNENLKNKEEKILRNYADFENYRKRSEKEIQNLNNEIKKKYILELIDINELLKNAIKDENPKDGIKIIIKNIEKFLINEKIRYIECIGKTFDHNYHHAVTVVDDEKYKDKTIIKEIKKGFLVDRDVLRPSHVIVSKKENKNK
jgi:molecular chaperone GrpE